MQFRNMEARWQEKCNEVMEFKRGIYASAPDPHDPLLLSLAGDVY